jgi:hypothetical protein
VEPSLDGSVLGESGQPSTPAAKKEEEQLDSDDDSDCRLLLILCLSIRVQLFYEGFLISTP